MRNTDLEDVFLVHSSEDDDEQNIDNEDKYDGDKNMDILDQFLGSVIKHRTKVDCVRRHNPIRTEQSQMIRKTNRLRRCRFLRYL